MMTNTLRGIAQLRDAGFVSAPQTAALEQVAARYAVAITPTVAELIDRDDPNDPIARQFIPDPAELASQPHERPDPIGDDAFSPVEGIVHDKPLVRWATGRQMSLYGLGIPPAQYAALGAGAPHMATVLRDRVERLSCDFSLEDNYFAWQAFGRSYQSHASGPLPPYLKQAHFETIRARADRVEVLNRSFTEYLRSRPDRSLDRYVLLDAQDWMADQQLNELWREITRTARPGARVIFRTAAEPSPLPARIDDP